MAINYSVFLVTLLVTDYIQNCREVNGEELSDIYNAHCAKNSGQKDINSEIVEKGKIMNLLDGFQSPFMNQNRLKYFCYRF